MSHDDWAEDQTRWTYTDGTWSRWLVTRLTPKGAWCTNADSGDAKWFAFDDVSAPADSQVRARGNAEAVALFPYNSEGQP